MLTCMYKRRDHMISCRIVKNNVKNSWEHLQSKKICNCAVQDGLLVAIVKYGKIYIAYEMASVY